MKQVLQSLKTGVIELADVPCPVVRAGHLLVQTTHSLISPGTERMLVEFGQASLINKARSQPEKVKQVLDKIRTDGLFPTLEAVFSRLDEPLPLGYCNVGRVVEIGRGVEGFSVGDLVASNGQHAEMVCVPTTLAAKLPPGVDPAEASFTVLGAIGLHGVRLLEPTLGENFVVIGLGLLGLIGAQLLRASGCNVLGVDVNRGRCEMAKAFGCETVCIAEGGDPVRAAQTFSANIGVDGVLVTASSKSDEIMHQAASMCRKRGRIVLVGAVGLELRRSDFYEKELTFQVSCSYGPGRYDPVYEAQVRDYPRAFVRWTVARNFEAVLDAIARGRLDVKPLITKSMPHADAATAYDSILKDSGVLGVIMRYPEQPAPTRRTLTLPRSKPAKPAQPGAPVVGVIGAGNFTKLILLPALAATSARIKTVVSAGGVSGFHAGRKFEAEEAGSDYRALLDDREVNTVFITTRHGAHAQMVADALRAGKHVFVEKPLAVDEAGLELVRAARRERPDLHLMVGFNRRFAPHAVKVKELLRGRSSPISVNIMVNAGDIPPEVWVHDREAGGGRIIGEGCHFIDLALFLTGSAPTMAQALMFGPQAGKLREDKMTISLAFADGSIATIHYWANGPKSFPKERVEVFSEGRALCIDNWRRLTAFSWPGAPRMNISIDKGHKAEVARFIDGTRAGGPPLIPFDELLQVSVASFAAVRSAEEGVTVRLLPEPREAPVAATAELTAS